MWHKNGFLSEFLHSHVRDKRFQSELTHISCTTILQEFYGMLHIVHIYHKTSQNIALSTYSICLLYHLYLVLSNQIQIKPIPNLENMAVVDIVYRVLPLTTANMVCLTPWEVMLVRAIAAIKIRRIFNFHVMLLQVYSIDSVPWLCKWDIRCIYPVEERINDDQQCSASGVGTLLFLVHCTYHGHLDKSRNDTIIHYTYGPNIVFMGGRGIIYVWDNNNYWRYSQNHINHVFITKKMSFSWDIASDICHLQKLCCVFIFLSLDTWNI